MASQIKPIKILFVEDEPIVRMITCAMLVELGYMLDSAINGKEALTKFFNGYDLIFMDLGLPDISGIEVTAEIRRLESIQKHTPIVAYTAYTDEIVKSECLAV